MLFQPSAFFGVTLPLTQTYVGHSTSSGPNDPHTFSGVSLSTVNPTRYILACVGGDETDVGGVTLDGASMTKLGPRMFIIAKPTGATGTFILSSIGSGYLSLAVFAIYNLNDATPYDVDHYERLDNPNIPMSCYIDVPASGAAFGYFSCDGGDQGNPVVTSGLTVRLNTTVDGRRVWAGSDTVATAVDNKTWECYNDGSAQWLSMVSFGPTTVPQVDPSSIGANLIGWWDPSDADNRTLVSGKVSALADKSGNGRSLTQGTDAVRPTLTVHGLGALDCMTFSGGQRIANSSIPLGGTTVDAFVVGTMSNGADDYMRLFSFTAAGYSNDWDNAGSFCIDRDSFSDNIMIERNGNYIASTDFAYDVPFIAAAYADGAMMGLLASLNLPALRADTTGTFGATGYLRIGGRASSEYWTGKVGEIVFAHNLTRTQRRGVFSYLKTKWSIA